MALEIEHVEGGTPLSRAFDDLRPPLTELVDDCVHCGFCLPTCPTYLLWGEEVDSPRGRIVLMREALEKGSEMSTEMVDAWDNCLGCMACVTACPSGVQYDKLLEDVRPQVERNHPRAWRERLLRRALFATFPHPGRLRAGVPFMVAYRALGLERAVSRSKLLERVPVLRNFDDLRPPVRLRDAVRRPRRRTSPTSASRGKVGLLQGCVQRVFFSDVNVDTIAVLAAEGYEVLARREPRCCGALQMHAGADVGARERAKRTIDAFADVHTVVVNAAGCGSAMKDYGHLLRDEPLWAEAARAFSAKVLDATELLAREAPRGPRHPMALKVAYHDACHLAHAQGVREQPRALLRTIPGLELVEPAEWEICCGSAGIYNLVKPEAAGELGRRKAENLLATGAQAIAAANPGCTLQIQAHLEALGRPLPILHPLELVAMSMRGDRLHGEHHPGR